MSSLRVFYARVTLSWGFIVRFFGVSAAQPSYPVPPPTTVVGAFAYSLSRVLGLNPAGAGIRWGDGRLVSDTMKPFLEATVLASAGLLSSGASAGVAVHQEINRIIASPYKSGGDVSNIREPKHIEDAIQRALPVQAVGGAYSPGLKLELLWAVDMNRLSKEFDISVERLDDAAKKAVHGVVRVGSKEGIVAIEKSIYIEKPDVAGTGGRIRTRLYVDHECVEEVLDPAYVIKLLIPDLRYRLKRYYVPARGGSNNIILALREDMPSPRFRITNECKAVGIPGLEGVIGVWPEKV